MPVFKTGAFNRSAIPPRWLRIIHLSKSNASGQGKKVGSLIAARERRILATLLYKGSP